MQQNDPMEKRLASWGKSWAASGRTPELSEELLDKVSRGLKPSLTPVRPIPRRGALVLLFLALLIVTATALIALLSKQGLMMMTALQIAIMAAILGTGGILFAVSLTAQMVPGTRQSLSTPVLLGLSSLGVIGAFAVLFPWNLPPGFASEGWPCGALELVIAVPSTLVFRALARRGALFSSPALGATMTGLSVFLALIPLQTQCMFLDAPHLLVWHGATGAVVVALGALAGGRSHAAAGRLGR
jgi:hypothetical protein